MNRKAIFRIIDHGILILVSILITIPIYWVLKTSLTGENLFNYPPSLIPKDPHIYYFVDVYYWIPFLRFFFNSVFVSFVVVVANLFFNSMAAYALRYSFPGKKLLILFYLSMMMIPFQTTIIPAFLLTKYMGLLNSYLGLAFPLSSTIINIFVFKAAFDSIPGSLFDAAVIDGMKERTILFKIYLPLAKPAIATNIILTFVWSWNNFIWPLIIISEKEMQTLPLGLSTFLSYFESTNGQMYAFVIMVIAPIILVFFMNQRRFISGIISGAIKG
jgi:ABC-type glycerol-3-phosphate transport system permease component